MEDNIHYFEENKPENTEVVFSLVKKKALEKNIKHVVIASTFGDTGVKAAEAFKDSGLKVVVVTHPYGPKGSRVLPENEQKMRTLGANIVTSGFAFGGVSASIRRTPPTEPGKPLPTPYWPALVPAMGDLVANVLRLFCQGMKVCLEITLMAADAGAVPVGENVIAIGGQGRGANTAVVIRATNSATFFDLDVQEIIAKPIKKMLPNP
ncbi:MAG: uncharacterized protein QG670_1157 [Thermoproteota archaeon]|nr:uncharacterized protein [Thermoproteota archaeon]